MPLELELELAPLPELVAARIPALLELKLELELELAPLPELVPARNFFSPRASMVARIACRFLVRSCIIRNEV